MFQPLPHTVAVRKRNAVRRPILWALVHLGCTAALCITTSAQSPTPGQPVNMVSGFTWPYGDPFLERQNEPSLAVSTRNPLHLLGGANDYRTVDLNLLEAEPGEINSCPAGTPTCPTTAEPWVGQYISTDSGAHWQSTLLPGFPQDASPQGLASPLHGFTTASDPVVRAGTNGLFYYAGIAFNRGTNNGVVFAARFMDLNNKENGNITIDSFPIRYINTGIVARGSTTQFLDKPSMAVDIPRFGRTCSLSVPQAGGTVAQTVPAGNVYVAYANIATVNGVTTSTIYFSRSLDCGQTWSTPIPLSRGYALSQGANIQIDPETGIVYVCWRTFDNGTTQRKDSVVVAASINAGYSFFPGIPVVTLPPFNINTPSASAFFDQGTTQVSFRSAAYPAMAVEDSGYPFVPGPIYFAWSERGVGPNGAARIMMLAIPGNLMISPSGITLPTPFPVDNGAITDDAGNAFTQGHQWAPSMTFIEGKLMLAYYDQRLDHTLGQDQPSVANGFFTPDAEGRFYEETRQLEGELAPANGSNNAAVFTPFISDADPPLTLRRHTVDVTLAQSNGGYGVPTFTYARVSQYDFGVFLSDSNGTEFHQLKVNPPDLPMFEKGTVPFMGDYIEIVGQMFVPTANGGWAFNNPRVNKSSPVHYAAFTSNQDVIPPTNGDWTQYFPITSGRSVYNGGPAPACQPGTGFEGDRNQNVYQTRITQGLFVSSPQNSKPLSTTVQRAFVVLVQNFTNFQKNFQLSIANQPPGAFSIANGTTGGFASFQQAVPNQPHLPSPLPTPVTTQTVTIAAHSGASGTVFALSSNPIANITVNVNEVDQSGNVVTGGLSSFILLNADGTVPPLTNPDGAPQTTNITGVEIYDPGITGPGITGANANATSITDPGITGPGITGTTCGQPGITGPGITGPGITGAGCTSPGITGPGITGPGITGPGITGTAPASPGITGTNVPAPGITGSSVSDATYTVSNMGNTTAGYNVALLGCETAPCSTTPLQLMSSQIYVTPSTDGQCNLIPVQQNIILSNNAHPVFTPASPGITGTPVTDAAFSLEPGDTALVTVRGYVPVSTMQTIVTQVTPAIVPQAIDTNTAATTPPVVTPLFITTVTLPDGVNGRNYSGDGVSLQAIGGKPPYTWSISLGNLPPGLTLNTSSGLVSGAPDTQAGTFPFTVSVTDSATPTPNTASRQFTIRVANPLAITTTALPPAVQGSNYDNFLTAVGGIPPINWTVSALPPGLVSSGSGVITGGATASGAFNVNVRATDSSSVPQTVVVTIPLTVFASSPLITFEQPPTTTAAGALITPPVVVAVTDASGAALSGVNVAIAIGNNPGGGVLSGGPAASTTAAGLAQFPNLSISATGTGYTLIASVSGVGGTASNSFNILLATPTALTAAVASPGSLALNWNPSISTVSGYNVYRGTTSGGPYTKIASVGVTNFTDGTVLGGQTYFYVVTSFVNNVESVFSNEASAIIPSETGFAYVAAGSTNSVSVISAATNAVVANVPVGTNPFGVAITPNGASVYVANAQSDSVSVINTATNTVSATIPLGQQPVAVAVTPDGSSVYVPNYNSANVLAAPGIVSVINTTSNSIVNTITVGFEPDGVAMTPDGTLAYVSNGASNTVSVINTAAAAVVATVQVGSQPESMVITPDGSFVYVANTSSKTVSVIATASNTVVATAAVGNLPSGIAITPNGRAVYVTNAGDQTVSVIEVPGNSVLTTIPVGSTPLGVATTPDGSFAYATNGGSNSVSVINTSGNAVVTTITGLTGPHGIAITPRPAAPTNVAVVPTAPAVTLSWTASASDNVVSYNIYRATSAGGPFTLVGSAASTVFTDTTAVGACPPITYNYYVTAVTAAGAESAPSNQASSPVGGC